MKNIKNILTIIMIFVIMIPITSSATDGEQQEFSIVDKINSFMLVNNPKALERVQEAKQRSIMESYEVLINEHMAGSTVYGPLTDKRRQEILENRISIFALVPEESFIFYPLITRRYAKQYADNHTFDSLIREEEEIWYAASRILGGNYYYTSDYSDVPPSIVYEHSIAPYKIGDQETADFLSRPEEIEQMVEEEIDENIIDCKIVAINGTTTILYLKGEVNEYGIEISSAGLEPFKIYTMSEIMQDISEYPWAPAKIISDTKPPYEAEMSSLMEAGLLQGTDKGADPLKPLSRMEATTILVRALGLENEPVSAESQFADVEQGSWGVKYANIALAQGITNGVGDGKFAPEERISAEQFGTLVLRSSGQTDFDWTQAVNILIERGIITQEQADTMDLFTRADMAKIIYEARENGLL